MTSIPKYVTDYVATLNEVELRHQLARLIVKSHRQQRAQDDLTSVEVTEVEWDPRHPEQCAGCHVVAHSYSTATVRSFNEKRVLYYCNKCHAEQWSWL